MEKHDLTAEESLDIIQAMIDRTKQRYEENGLTILIWGVLVMIAGISQYTMIKNGLAAKSYYAWIFTMIPGFIITFISKFIENKKKIATNQPIDTSGYIWLMAGSMAMLTGFVFNSKFGIGFTAMIYAPFCVAALSTALKLKDNLLIVMSIIAAILCYVSLSIPFQMHPLMASAIALVLMVIPGIKLYNDYKKRNRV